MGENAVRERMRHVIARRGTAVFRMEKRPQEERDREAMEELYRAKDIRKFNEKLNRSRRDFVPQADVCRDNHGNIPTSEREVVESWRQHYDEHFNGDVASTEGGVVTDLGVRAQDERFPVPNLQEIEEEVGRLKNKAAEADQLPSKLLKYGGEALVRALPGS